MQDLDFDVTITGFDAPKIDFKIAALGESKGEGESVETPPTGSAVTRPGDLWLLEALSVQMHRTVRGGRYAGRMGRRSKPPNPFRWFDSSPDVIRLVVLMYVRYPLSLRNVEDLLRERGVDLP